MYLDSPEGARWPHPADKEYPALLKKLFVTHCKHHRKGQCASKTKQTKKKQPNLAFKYQIYKSQMDLRLSKDKYLMHRQHNISQRNYENQFRKLLFSIAFVFSFWYYWLLPKNCTLISN
jgi:hypothetical protein